MMLLLAGCDGSAPGYQEYGFNRAPWVNITSPDEGAIFLLDEAIPLVCRVTDPDGPKDVVELTLDSSVSGAITGFTQERLDGKVVASMNLSLPAGDHTITCAASDAQGEPGQASVNIVVAETAPPPRVDITTPVDGDTWYEGQTVAFAGTAEDDKYAPFALTYSWSVQDPDGLLIGAAAGNVGPDGRIGATWVPDAVGTWTSRLTVENPGKGVLTELQAIQITEAPPRDDDNDGVTAADGDCDDADPTVRPGAPEMADGIDNNCDGVRDEGTDLYDDDGDGFCEDENACTDPLHLPGDCDDDDDEAHPGLEEICHDDRDNDCDGAANTEDAIGCTDLFFDSDRDTFGKEGVDARCLCQPEGTYTAPVTGDCNDGDDEIYPGAPERPNSLDDDCDNLVDEDLDKTDIDGDGYCANSTTCVAGKLPGDCDETNRLINPGAKERCDTPTVDENCNNVFNEEDAVLCNPFWKDEDRDGHGVGADRRCLCEAEFPHTNTGTQVNDCDDQDPEVYPGQPAWFTRRTFGNNDYDFNCSNVEEKQHPLFLFDCSFDLDTEFCDVNMEGWTDGRFPACGETGNWSNDCSAGFFTCSADNKTATTMGCH